MVQWMGGQKWSGVERAGGGGGGERRGGAGGGRLTRRDAHVCAYEQKEGTSGNNNREFLKSHGSQSTPDQPRTKQEGGGRENRVP